MNSCISVLQICKGVAKTPNDTNSAETGLDVIDLLDPQGFALDEWTPKYAGMKSGIWEETPLTPGRRLIVGEDDNVTETLKITVSAPDLQTLGVMVSHLMLMRQDAKNFGASGWQTQPVYMVYRQIGEPGNRYALIVNMEIAPNDEPTTDDTGRYIREFTLTIEREPYWRAEVAPGENPKKWTKFAAGATWNYAAADMVSGIDHAIYGALTNRQEFQTATTFATRNWIDIPAASIPGDAPALVELAIKMPASRFATVFIAKSTRNTTMVSDAGVTLPRHQSFCVGAATTGADTSITNDATVGIKHVPRHATNQYRGDISFATTTGNVARFTWPDATYGVPIDQTLLRGRYQLYVRGQQVNGTYKDTSCSIVIDNASGSSWTSSTFYLPALAAGNNAFSMTYAGTVDIPLFLDSPSYSGTDGGGLSVQDITAPGSSNMRIILTAARSTGASTIQLTDIVFVPLDEGLVVITPSNHVTNGAHDIIYDNTGYFEHGKPDDYHLHISSSGLPAVGELAGNPIRLTPGVTNRLLFVVVEIWGTASTTHFPPETFTVRGNIVPRWIGARGV